MKRLLLAAAAVAWLALPVAAQPPAPTPRQPTYPNPYLVPAPVPNPNPVPPPPTYAGPPGPAIPVPKSGGLVVGLQGYYPYDTGLYLLAETGVSRQSGWFTMVSPGGNVMPGDTLPAPVYPASRGHLLFKHFRH